MDRRHFLKALVAVPAFAALAPSEIWSKVAPEGPITGWAAGQTLHAGDILTIDGAYAVNPITRTPTEYIQQFVVTATTRAGDIAPIHPHLYLDGPLQNVTEPDWSAQMRPIYVNAD
jgi:hypothetical protein